MKKYNHKAIEGKWQKEWARKKIYKTSNSSKKDKFYVLDMFPYPSGEGLHVGHPKGYIATDIVSRMKRMQGKNVLHPMGFDAFGLPAENYAIKTKTNPIVSVAKNVLRYKKQLEILGLDYDWSREINTTDPRYYKWTQWIFLKLLEKGLAYESYEPINWCPSCKTGLANEDVENGKCERCGTLVEKKPMRQWVLKITDYAERLLNDLDAKSKDGSLLLNWPRSIVESQKNWIGKSEGAEIEFRIKDCELRIKVFTTRADTLFGVTYLVLAPEHPLLTNNELRITNNEEVQKYIAKSKTETEIERTDVKREKTGVELKGVKAINSANGEAVPVWVADYVLADYGTGAVMAVPAHDERDWEFAKKYNLPIKQVIAPYFTANPSTKDAVRPNKKTVKRKTAYALVYDKKTASFLGLNWEKFGWHSGIIGGVDEGESYKDAALREIKEETGYTNLKFVKELGGEQHNHFFAAHKDENRYAIGKGMLFELIDDNHEPVSEEHTKNHKHVWIKAAEMGAWLNLSAFNYIWSAYNAGTDCFVGEGLLVDSGKFDGVGSLEAKKQITKFVGGKEKTTYKLRDWVFSRQRYWGEPIPVIHCEKDGIVPVPEEDLPVKLPKVKHYEPTGTGESPLAVIEKWVNVKCPKCGGKAKRETNTMPQWAGSSWYYIAYCISENLKSQISISKQLSNSKTTNKIDYWLPVDFYVGGAEHATRHLIYARFWHKFLYDIGVVSTIEPFIRLQHVGLIMGEDGRKMSKRFGNIVNPDEIVKTYGADTLRLFEMFLGPFDQQASWSTDSIIGPRRFLEKVWNILPKIDKTAGELGSKSHALVKKVGEDILAMKFNTAVSAMMVFAGELDKQEKVNRIDYEALLKVLAPFAPHISDELWSMLGHKKSIHLESWPDFDASKIAAESVTIAVQVNGKLRATFEAAPTISEGDAKKQAATLAEKWISGKPVKKTIYVKGRLINFVV